MANVYKYRSNWTLQNQGGSAFGAGASLKVLSASAGTKRIKFVAKRSDDKHNIHLLSLQMSVTGVQFSAEIGFELISKMAAGLSVAYIKPDKNESTILLNTKSGRRDMLTSEFLGPCSLVSFDVGKASAGGKDICKYRGKTYLFLGMHKSMVDRDPDWLQKVVDKSTSSSLGGNVIKFNNANGIFSNARAAIPLDLSERNSAVKLESNVALYSGQIRAVSMRKLKSYR